MPLLVAVKKLNEMEQIIYELNGKKYLLVEILITESSNKKMDAKFKKYNCIRSYGFSRSRAIDKNIRCCKLILNISTCIFR